VLEYKLEAFGGQVITVNPACISRKFRLCGNTQDIEVAALPDKGDADLRSLVCGVTYSAYPLSLGQIEEILAERGWWSIASRYIGGRSR
jgi:hypothetical protein